MCSINHEQKQNFFRCAKEKKKQRKNINFINAGPKKLDYRDEGKCEYQRLYA